jgi:hypothetical protein
VPLRTERLDALTPSPVLPLPQTPEAVNGVAGLGAGADGEDSSGVADSVAGAARHSEWETLICAPDWDCDTALRFLQGYRDGGAPYPEERVVAMVKCESSWRVDPGGYHLGLAQFDPGTWAIVSAITGLADPYSAYHQGYNVAEWASMVSPGTSAGWPHCW